MRASTRKGANFGNGRPADLSEVPSSVLPHLPSLSLQLSGELYDSGKRSRGFPLMESPFSDALPYLLVLVLVVVLSGGLSPGE